MALYTSFMVFAIIWMLVMFLVLPFGVTTDPSPSQGHAKSAPLAPSLGKKVFITTLLSVVLFIIAQWALNSYSIF